MKNKKLSDVELVKMERRQFIVNLFAANGFLGLRSMLLGLPPSFLVSRAMAAEGVTSLIFSSDSSASPVNCNAPGTYISDFAHPTDAEAAPVTLGVLAPSSFSLGSKTVLAAKRWANMPAALRNSFQFFHLSTQENAHFNSAEVMKINGALKRQQGIGADMVPSAIAQSLAEKIGTISKKPICLDNQVITYDGIPQPFSAPLSLKSAFGPITDPNKRNILSYRDKLLDKLYSDIKYSGTIRQAQFLENHALSRDEARTLIEGMGSLLADVTGNVTRDQIIAAAAVIVTKAAPVATISVRFGGDNHVDAKLSAEANSLIEGVGSLEFLWEKLNSLGVADTTTFALHNVFGRALKRNSAGGRDHNASHSVMLMFGPHVNGGVSGDVMVKTGRDGGAATGINSQNGTKTNPDITHNETLASSAKTLMKACGVAENVINQRLPTGKIVRSAIK